MAAAMPATAGGGLLVAGEGTGVLATGGGGTGVPVTAGGGAGAGGWGINGAEGRT